MFQRFCVTRTHVHIYPRCNVHSILWQGSRKRFIRTTPDRSRCRNACSPSAAHTHTRALSSYARASLCVSITLFSFFIIFLFFIIFFFYYSLKCTTVFRPNHGSPLNLFRKRWNATCFVRSKGRNFFFFRDTRYPGSGIIEGERERLER